MAEERYNYDMAKAIDKLLNETAGLQDENSEWVLTFKALAEESRAMRAAAVEYAMSRSTASSSTSSESSLSEASSSSEGSDQGDSDESSVSSFPSCSDLDEFAQYNTRIHESYKRAVEYMVEGLREWRMELEEAKYKAINFDAPLTDWTRKERNAMKNEIRLMSCEIRKQKIIDKVFVFNKLRVAKRITMEKKLAVQMIEMLLQDIFLLRVAPFKDVVFPLTMENVYDWDRVSKAVQGKHTPAECQEFWYTKLHPDINGKSWSKSEIRSLIALADAYNMQHWDEIAKQLNTYRNGFQCFVQYRRYYYKDFKGRVLVFKTEAKYQAEWINNE